MSEYRMGTKCVQAGYTWQWRTETGADHPVDHF